MPKVFIIVLNWNQLLDTSECVTSLSHLNYPDYHTIVVDNGSSDGSPDVIAEQFPEVTLIRNEQNFGFVGGNNIGINVALDRGADYLFILNNDTSVDSEMMTALVEVSESDSSIAAVGPQIFYHDEPQNLWFLGANLEWPLAEIKFWHQNEKNPYPERQVLDTDYLAGAGMLVRASAIQALGAFDPYFFIYWDDVELCVRFARAGYAIKAVTTAYMWHKVSRAATAGKTSTFLMARNHLYLCRKYNSTSDFWLQAFPTIFYRKSRQLLTSRFSEHSWAAFSGMLAYFKGFQGRVGLDGV